MSTSSDRRRGIVTHDHRITVANIDSTETTADQAGPHPGPAVDNGSSSMVIRTSGTMAASQSYTITAERGGFPGSHETAAGFSYDDTAGNTHYWDPPGVLTGCEFVAFNTTGTGTDDSHKEYEPNLCVLESGVVLMCTRAEANSGGTLSIRIRSYDPDTNTWTVLETITDSTTIDDSQRIGPCLVVTPDGIVHLYYYVAATTQIAHWISGDNGANWSKASDGCCTSVLQDLTGVYDFTTYGASIRGAYSAGQVELFVGLEGYGTDVQVVLLCTSSDGGYSLRPDFEYTSTYPSLWNDMFVTGVTPEPGGGFRVAFNFINLTPSPNPTDSQYYQHIALDHGYIDFRVLTGAYSDFAYGNGPIPDAAHASQASEGGTLTDPEATGCTWVTEDGLFQAAIAYGDQDDTTPGDRGAVSIDRVTVSGDMEQLSATTIDHGSGAAGGTYLRRIAAVETRGTTILVGQLETNGGQLDDGSIVAFYLGGHTTQSMPPVDSAQSNKMQRVPWAWQFHALDDPDSGGTFQSSVSSGTLRSEKQGLYMSCTNTQQYFFIPNTGEEPSDENAELLFEIAAYGVSSAGHTGGVNQPRCGALLTYRHNAGAQQYTVYLSMSSTGITLYDPAGTASLGTASVDLTGDVEVRVALYRNRVSAWYREVDSRVERTWTQFVTKQTVTGAAVSAATHIVQWGMISTAASGAHEMYVKRVQVAEIPAPLASTGINDIDGYPRPLAANPITIPGGLRIEAIDGPAVPGDSWQVDTAYYYGFENLFSDNPGQVWRSTQDNTAMTIAFDMAGFANSAGQLEEYAFAAALLNSNLRSWKIQRMTYLAKGTAVDWLDVAAQPFAPSANTSGVIAASGVGTVLYPDSGGETLRWIEANELAGCQFYDDAAGQSFSIVGNSSGEWSGEYSHREAVIYLDRDEASSVDGSNGIFIHLKNSAGFIWDYPTLSRWLLLTIPAQKTLEGYYEIGRFIGGPLHVFGREYSEDRSLEQRSNVELTTRRDGSRYGYSRGPQRRSVTVSWREGVDESDLYKTTEPKEVPFIAGYTSTEPVANPADTVKLVRGLFEQVDGASEPILYLPAIPTDVQSGSLTARDALLYGRIVSQIEIGQILGNEEEDQVHRLGAIRIEEEIG